MPNWITPEIVEERVDVSPAEKDDVWALGGLAYELFSTCGNQRTPFSSLEHLINDDEDEGKHHDSTQGDETQ